MNSVRDMENGTTESKSVGNWNADEINCYFISFSTLWREVLQRSAEATGTSQLHFIRCEAGQESERFKGSHSVLAMYNEPHTDLALTGKTFLTLSPRWVFTLKFKWPTLSEFLFVVTQLRLRRIMTEVVGICRGMYEKKMYC